MILPLAIFYDNSGSPVSIRYFQFTMKQDVAADFTWEYYNNLIITPWSTLDLLEHRTFDVSLEEARAKAGLLSIQTGKYWGPNHVIPGVEGLTAVRADKSLAEDWLQVIAIKRPASSQGSSSVPVVSYDKLLTGIVECLIVDYKGNIKRYKFDDIMRLSTDGKIKLGNVDYRGHLNVWRSITLTPKTEYACEELRTQKTDMLVVAELNGQVDAKNRYGDLRDSMSLVLPDSESVVVPNGWHKIVSNPKHYDKCRTLVCPDRMTSVNIDESMLKVFKAPVACSEFKLKGNCVFDELYLPKTLHVRADSDTSIANSKHTNFILRAKSIPCETIDQSEYYDLDEYEMILSTAPNLKWAKIAQPRIREKVVKSYGILEKEQRVGYSTYHTIVDIKRALSLEHLVFLKPKHSTSQYHATNDTGQEIRLGMADNLKSIRIEGKSYKTYMKLSATSCTFALDAHAIRELQIEYSPDTEFIIHCRIKYLHDALISLDTEWTPMLYQPTIIPHVEGSSFIQTIHIFNNKVEVLPYGG